MKIAVVGTGYVGLVTAACLADKGNHVAGIDINADKIESLNGGIIPIYEPGLDGLVKQNIEQGRLQFTSSYEEAIPDTQIVFLAVGTPQFENGDANLDYVFNAADSVASAQTGELLVVIKSTVPTGTNTEILKRLQDDCTHPIDLASNPEFLKEGSALDDFNYPDRVVIGVRNSSAENMLRTLYEPFLTDEQQLLVMSPESAEMTKYVANAMLATKISFINEMANLCEHFRADIDDVRKGIGRDQRIGFHFLHPGVGWGGSCFPKDVQAILAMGRRVGYPLSILNAVRQVNTAQKRVLTHKIKSHYGRQLRGKTLAIWGLAFKPNTDDIREAPSIPLMEDLLAEGVALRVFDPVAMANIRDMFGKRLTYCESTTHAAEGADGLVLVTEWKEFRKIELSMLRDLLAQPVVFDGRNLFDPIAMKSGGFTYYSIGR